MRVKSGQLIAAVAALVLLASATTFAQTSAGQRALRNIGVGGDPSRYTGLAFVDPAKLPTALPAPGGDVLVQFSIANHEAAATTYRWQVVVTHPRPQSLVAGVVHLAQGATAHVERIVTVECSSRTQLAVRLSSGESIDFWMECTH